MGSEIYSDDTCLKVVSEKDLSEGFKELPQLYANMGIDYTLHCCFSESKMDIYIQCYNVKPGINFFDTIPAIFDLQILHIEDWEATIVKNMGGKPSYIHLSIFPLSSIIKYL